MARPGKNVIHHAVAMKPRPAEISAVRVCRSMHFAVAGSAEAEYCKVAFDYRGRTVFFGCGMDESDAFRLVHEIHARAPWLATL